MPKLFSSSFEKAGIFSSKVSAAFTQNMTWFANPKTFLIYLIRGRSPQEPPFVGVNDWRSNKDLLSRRLVLRDLMTSLILSDQVWTQIRCLGASYDSSLSFSFLLIKVWSWTCFFISLISIFLHIFFSGWASYPPTSVSGWWRCSGWTLGALKSFLGVTHGGNKLWGK